MKLDSKYFDSIRTARSRPSRNAAPAPEPKTRACDWPDCSGEGSYPAPGSPGEGGRRYFCLDHVRVYNKSYNFFEGMDGEDVDAYRRAATTGHRPTWALGARRAKGVFPDIEFQDPLEIMSGMGARPEEGKAAAKQRAASSGQTRALNVLGLDETASAASVKKQYKALIKRYHPDANGGDRSFEERLQRVIQAHEYLKASGFC